MPVPRMGRQDAIWKSQINWPVPDHSIRTMRMPMFKRAGLSCVQLSKSMNLDANQKPVTWVVPVCNGS